MVSSAVQEIHYTGNASTVTAYSVPFTWTAATQVKASRLDAGTGTVTIVAGVATFSSAQSTLGIGSHFRIAGETYTIHEKTSTTVFTITEEVSVASSSFHILEDAVALVEGSTFTLAGVSGASSITTNPAIAATALIRIYRQVPYTQLLSLASSGPLPVEDLELSLDEIVMMIQQLATAIENAGIIIPSGSLTFADSTVFANDAARAAAVPTRLYQIGVQTNTLIGYYASGTSAGNWTQFTFKSQVITYPATPATTAPLYTGELLTYKGPNDPKDKYAPALYKATGTSAGNLELVKPNRTYGCFQHQVWDDTVPLDRAMKKMAGHSGLYRYVDRVTATVAIPGMGTLELRFFTSDSSGGRDILFDNAEITTDAVSSTSITTTFLDPGFGAVGSTVVIAPTDRIYAEIVSAGEETFPTAVAGSTTINDLDPTNCTTGSWLDHDEGNGILGAITGATAGVRSHAAASDDPNYRINGRIFARTLAGTWTGGTRLINSIVAADTGLLCAGDRVIGSTVHPDCRIESVPAAGTSITLTHPLLGDTTAVTVISEDRPPVVQFTNISEASGQTVLDAHDTSFILAGDSLWGTDVPALARVTAKSSTTVTSSAALTGNITGYTVRPPRRAATITAGTAIINCTTTDLLIGGKVIGTVVPPDTFITGVQPGQLTVNNLLPLNASGAATDVVEVTREELQIAGASLTAASTSVTLPFAYTTTYIDMTLGDYYVTGSGIQPGTFVTGASGSTLTLSKAAALTGTATLRLYRLSRWKGLSVAIAGNHYAGST